MLLPLLLAAAQTVAPDSASTVAALVCGAGPEGGPPVARVIRSEEAMDAEGVAPGVCPGRWIPDLERAVFVDEGRRLAWTRWTGAGWSPPERVGAAAAIEQVRLAPGRIGIPGGRVVFSGIDTEGDRNVWQLHGRTGRVSPITRIAGVDDGAVVSPDGRHVWFHSDRAGTVDLWRWEVGAAETVRFTNAPGRELLPAPADDRIWYLWVEGGAPPRLMVRLFSSLGPGVVDPAVRLEAPRLSPDGDRLCWIRDRDGDAEVAVLDRTTGAVYLPVPSPGTESNCHWDPERPGVLWFESDRTGDVDVYRWIEAGGHLLNVTRTPGDDRLIDLLPGG